eukprot:TRINITY_DN4197_c0_g1_i2.p1 TRINITY_DN4197_c0_g1~~TRINITY_DN4197_c0_g1_i2.p1  ORF type:complete len:141 (-),score=11.70 TRINITY_DN4197_c0_g1_i2:68-490(-)
MGTVASQAAPARARARPLNAQERAAADLVPQAPPPGFDHGHYLFNNQNPDGTSEGSWVVLNADGTARAGANSWGYSSDSGSWCEGYGVYEVGTDGVITLRLYYQFHSWDAPQLQVAQCTHDRAARTVTGSDGVALTWAHV